MISLFIQLYGSNICYHDETTTSGQSRCISTTDADYLRGRTKSNLSDVEREKERNTHLVGLVSIRSRNLTDTRISLGNVYTKQ